MAAHSSILAWKISWTEEPGGLQSWGRRVGHDSGLTHLMYNTGELDSGSVCGDANGKEIQA